MRTEQPWRGLAWRLGVGLAAAVAVVVLGRVVGLAFQPVATVLLALMLAAGSWFLTDQFEPAERPHWERPQPPQRTAAFLVDTRTRRLATVLARAQPGAGFENATMARTLAELVAARGHGALSPELTGYLQAAHDGKPPTLTRRTLLAYLKEIDEL